MKLTLIPDWQQVLKKAWAIKYSMLAASLSVLELIVPAIPAVAGTIPTGVFVGISIFLNIFVIPAVRILSQKEIHNVVETSSNDAK